MDRIIIVGSSNTDLVIKTDRLPGPGETVLGGTFFMNPGGKGANQAVAAARLGGLITFIAKTGKDVFGMQSIEGFEREGIDTTGIIRDALQPSGVALITVDKNAQNTITVASGANGALLPDDLESLSEKIEPSAIVLLQLEIPMKTVEYVVACAREKNARIIMNPAPAQPLTDELLKKIDIITPNETEATELTGIQIRDVQTAADAARKINRMGVTTVIITLGEKGALIFHDGHAIKIDAPKVEALDTTAAGDVFNGALAVALAEGYDLSDAVTFACRAASISVTRLGAQSSAPARAEVNMIPIKTH
jgi:ribokinase